MEATRSRLEPSLVAQRSRYDDHNLRVSQYSEDFTSNSPTQSTFASGGLINPDIARRFQNVIRSSNVGSVQNMFPSEVVDFSTNSNYHGEAGVIMNSNQPLALYVDQQDYLDGLRRCNIPQQCTNWPSELSYIDDQSNTTQNANAVTSAPTKYLVRANDTNNSRYRDVHYPSSSCEGNAQEGLSLSLSSNPNPNPSSNNYIVEADTKYRHYNLGFLKHSNIIAGGGRKESGKALQADVMGISTFGPQWSSGPLGPFTGYATILKSSKFLKPAQDLLDELCDFSGGQKPVEMRVILQRIEEESSMSTGDIGGWSSSSNSTSFAAEYQQKKAALFCMYDEVCRRYKHYYQQMQMVVSSFEAVAGLSASTPYISLAMKAVARNFRCPKNAISEQLRILKNSLMMEDNFPSHRHAGTSKVNHRSFQRRTRTSLLGSNTTGFFDAQSHGWRPQRGLPERSVAVLRAWMFEHFLHPYPTDTDKHMLANQTGLSRNQVSNWFINARVRLWKPMVEEIHELETKAEGRRQDSNTNEKHHHVHDGSIQRDDRNANPPPTESAAADEQIRFSGIGGSSGDLRGHHHVSWQLDSEIRSRLECHHQVPISNMEEGSNLIGLERYPQSSGVDQFGGGRGGAVSLSLGLMHNNVGGSSRQQHHQRHDHHDGCRQHFGGGMMYNCY